MGLLFTRKKKCETKPAGKICFICGNSESIQKGLIGQRSLRECSRCGIQYIDPIPDKKRLEKIYSDYYKAWGIEHSRDEVSYIKKKTFSNYLKEIVAYVPEGKLLDVGCATGEFLMVAQESGFDVYGIEVSPYGVRECRELFGENKIRAESLKDGDFPSGFFDVIILSDVIEHIEAPVSFLDILWNILKPQGVLMIVTPNTSSWTRKLMGMHWLHYKEEHIYYFNCNNICKFLSSGFEILVAHPDYKFLTAHYCANIIGAYSNSPTIKKIAAILRPLFVRMKLPALQVNIGEIFILCRKKADGFY